MADESQCTSDDPTNHQGDTCPVHEAGPPVWSDTDIVIGRLQAAEWDAKLARKTGLSPDRREIYLLNIQQQLESALKILKGEA